MPRNRNHPTAKASAKPKRTCIFCGGLPLCNEDVLPKWASELERSLRSTTNPSFTIHRGLGDGLMPRDGRQWQSNLLGVKAGQVCKTTCNSGWMSNLETRASPLLTPMIEGKETFLTPEEQLIVGQWAVKTATMVQYIRTPVVPVSPERLLWVRTQPEPPPKAWVGLARYAGGQFASWAYHKGILWGGDGPKPKTAYGHPVTLSLGHLVIQTVVWEGDLELSFDLSAAQRLSMIQIWPRTTGIILRWPPTLELRDNDLVAVAQTFAKTDD